MSTDRLSPAERTLRARLAAQTKWAHNDPYEGTRNAREAFLQSFLVKVDPDGLLPVEERVRRAESLRRAHFTSMALASARARRRASA